MLCRDLGLSFSLVRVVKSRNTAECERGIVAPLIFCSMLQPVLYARRNLVGLELAGLGWGSSCNYAIVLSEANSDAGCGLLVCSVFLVFSLIKQFVIPIKS